MSWKFLQDLRTIRVGNKSIIVLIMRTVLLLVLFASSPLVAATAQSLEEPEGGAPSAVEIPQPASDENVTKTLEVEVDTSREQLETILEQNRELAEQTRFLEQEVQRLRNALRDNKNPSPAAQIATELDNTPAPSTRAVSEEQQPVAPITESEHEQVEIAATEPPSYSGVVLGGLVLLLGYWSVLGSYIRTRIGFLRAEA